MFTFKTKKEYLAYIANWKEEYKQLTIDIRQSRLKYKDVLRRRSWAMNQAQCAVPDKIAHRTYEIYRKYEELLNGDVQYQAFWKDYHWVDSQKATDMLEELKLAKLESQRQYLEQKKMLVA